MDKKLFTAEKIADVLEEMFIKDRFIKWDGTNLRDVVAFTGLSPNFNRWFLSWDEYEAYVKEHGGVFKIFGDNGYYEAPVGSWIVKAPDGLNYAFGEGVKYVYDGYEDLKGVIECIEEHHQESDEQEIPIEKTEGPITSFYPEVVKEFNGYPEYCLACAGYLGMAVANLWDKDWAHYANAPYSHFLGKRGFDDMDDHITECILHETRHSVAAMQTCALEAHHFLMRESPEPGTADAYRKFLATSEVMYRIGAAIELCRQGYRMEAV